MAALSPRARWHQKQAGRRPDPLKEYEVLDPHHKPDLNGELAGGKVYRRGAKEFVMLTEDQARFYLDSGGIQDVQKAAEDKDAGPHMTASQAKAKKLAQPQGRKERLPGELPKEQS